MDMEAVSSLGPFVVWDLLRRAFAAVAFSILLSCVGCLSGSGRDPSDIVWQPYIQQGGSAANLKDDCDAVLAGRSVGISVLPVDSLRRSSAAIRSAWGATQVLVVVATTAPATGLVTIPVEMLPRIANRRGAVQVASFATPSNPSSLQYQISANGVSWRGMSDHIWIGIDGISRESISNAMVQLSLRLQAVIEIRDLDNACTDLLALRASSLSTSGNRIDLADLGVPGEALSREWPESVGRMKINIDGAPCLEVELPACTLDGRLCARRLEYCVPHPQSRNAEQVNQLTARLPSYPIRMHLVNHMWLEVEPTEPDDGH